MKELLSDILNLRWGNLFVKPTRNPTVQFFRYVFVGGFAAIVDWAVLYVLTKLGMHYLISAIFAFVAGLAVNFLLSKRMVFNGQEARVRGVVEFGAYAVTGVVGLGITELLLYLFTDKVGLHFILSKMIATAVVLVWNYLSRKLLIYK